MQTQSQPITRIIGTMYGVLWQGTRGFKEFNAEVPEGKSVAEVLRAEFESCDDFQPRTKAWGPGTMVVPTQRTVDRQDGRRVVTTVDTSVPPAGLDTGVLILDEDEADGFMEGASLIL